MMRNAESNPKCGDIWFLSFDNQFFVVDFKDSETTAVTFGDGTRIGFFGNKFVEYLKGQNAELISTWENHPFVINTNNDGVSISRQKRKIPTWEQSSEFMYKRLEKLRHSIKGLNKKLKISRRETKS